MGDRKSSKTHIKIVMNYLSLLVGSPEELKDEAYIQVLKQIKNNPNQDRTLSGWSMLSILASSEAPSFELFLGLMNFLLSEVSTNIDLNIINKANFIIPRLLRIFQTKRTHTASEEEIAHIEEMKQLMIPIHFFSQTQTSVAFENYYTVGELKVNVMRKLKLSLSKLPYYGVYEVCEKRRITG